ncbi:MAG: HlyD family efflux transporter periplasmic adaptor subunit [Defluviicoccus sp.]
MPDGQSEAHAVETTGSAGPPAHAPLFRPQALAERRSRWLGTVLLAPQISHTLFAVFAALAASAVLALLFFAEFTRTARISGWLMPDQGLLRIVAPLQGVISQLHVKEGAQVRKGQSLLVFSAELQSEAVGATREEIVRHLIRRRDSVIAERALQHRLHLQEIADLKTRIETLTEEQHSLERERDLQRDRVALAEETERRQRRLRAEGVVPVQRLEQAQKERIDESVNLRGIERTWVSLQGSRLTLEGELRNLPLKYEAMVADMERSIATLEQQLAETEAQRQLVILAPQDGTVTALQAETGSSVNTSVPLLAIVPAGSKLEAQLFSPSRAIGFVQPGQRVLLRYQSFPYQKFGHYEGVVASVSRSAISPAELTQQLAGLTSLVGTSEPVYRISVALASQTVTAYGKPVPLHPGMQLEADILIERRRLIEWVLDPLFSLTGRL